jgi:hypothetical protein
MYSDPLFTVYSGDRAPQDSYTAALGFAATGMTEIPAPVSKIPCLGRSTIFGARAEIGHLWS